MIRSFFVILTFLVLFSHGCGSSGACGCCGCKAKAKARAAKRVSGDVTGSVDENDDGNIFGLKVWNDTRIHITEQNFQKLTVRTREI